MIKIYVDMSAASEAEKKGLRPSDIVSSVKDALDSRSVTPDFSVSFTNERIIEEGRVLVTSVGGGVSPGAGRAPK